MRDEFVHTTQGTLRLLDRLLIGGGDWWDGFFADRAKPCPFLVDWPDESLAEWLDQGRITPGRVLELGPGNGRNAIFLARHGCQVDAVDFSAEAIGWAREKAASAGVAVSLRCADIFDAVIEEGVYDLVYDSGCFHHLAPHRRADYVALVRRALRPGGRFGLVCFRPEGGSGLSDREVYEKRTLGGGLGYSPEQLRVLWDEDPFSVQVLRPMVEQGGGGPWFGAGFLWAVLVTKR